VDRSVGLFRNVGFRRLGSSRWFAFASDPHHASHNIASNQDHDPPLMADREKLLDVECLFGKGDLRSLDDKLLLRELEVLFETATEHDSRWYAVDRNGNNILHLAAEGHKTELVKWIIGHNTNLGSRRNDHGWTAIEHLHAHLEEFRTQRCFGTMIIHKSDDFQGFDASAINCLYLLSGIIPSPAQTLRLKFGCSCGQCAAGLLSPRMRFMLLNQADMQYDLLTDVSDIDSGPMFVDNNPDALQFVPTTVRENLKTNKSMRQGFVILCRHFATCLKRTGTSSDGLPECLPTIGHVLEVLDATSEWPPCSRNYLQRGGPIASVGSYVFWSTQQEDDLIGDGSVLDIYENDSLEDTGGLSAEYRSLARCRNDFEYGFVSTLLGYDTRQRGR
jgi:hypothetical protein